MMLVISKEDFSSFSQAVQKEILAALRGSSGFAQHETPDAIGSDYDGIGMEGVADITARQMRNWMSNASEKTKVGLRLFAEKPVVTAQELLDAGVENLAHFQSRTTIRTRTVTGDKGTYLFGWDDWSEAAENQGRYAVTPTTHRALRAYFKLE